jgi:hypothetical protein
MAACTDPRLTYLNHLGYNVVRLPRKGIVPLGVIGRDGKAKSWLGTLDQIWDTTAAVPAAGPPQPVAGLQGTKTNDLDLSIGLDILKNALSGMFGATVPSLDFAYKNAKSLQFAFREVRTVGMDPFAIGNFLSTGTLKEHNPFVKRFFEGQKNVEALVVTEVLEAKAIGVIAKQAGSAEVAVDVPQIQALLGAKVGVKTANASNTEITYEGAEYLAFGYKPFGIRRADGQWEIYGVEADAGHSFGVRQSLQPLVDQHELVDLAFDAVPART